MRVREPFNAGSHLVGFLLAGLGTWYLLQAASGQAQLLAFGIYGATLLLLYGASSCYHGLPLGVNGLRRLRTLDHIAIYFLIAGTYTPVAAITLRDSGGPVLLAASWAIAAAGIPFKIRWLDAPVWISTGTYLGMGYLALVAVVPLAGDRYHFDPSYDLADGLHFWSAEASDRAGHAVSLQAGFGVDTEPPSTPVLGGLSAGQVVASSVHVSIATSDSGSGLDDSCSLFIDAVFPQCRHTLNTRRRTTERKMRECNRVNANIEQAAPAERRIKQFRVIVSKPETRLHHAHVANRALADPCNRLLYRRYEPRPHRFHQKTLLAARDANHFGRTAVGPADD